MSVGEELNLNPATQMAKAPGISTKEGRQKGFYGLDVGVGAALLLGVAVSAKVGYQKK